MEKLYQWDHYRDISWNLHEESKDYKEHKKIFKPATVNIKVLKTVGRKWLNIYVKNKCKWDSPFISYWYLGIYFIIVEIWKSILSQYPSAATKIWKVPEAWNSVR